MLFQIFRLNFSWAETCLKCTILVTNFQKSPSAGGFPPQAPLNLQYWWSEVPWFDQILVFEADYDKIELQNIVTTFLWRHYHYVTEKRHQNNVTKIYPIWAPLPPIKISGYASETHCLIVEPNFGAKLKWNYEKKVSTFSKSASNKIY